MRPAVIAQIPEAARHGWGERQPLQHPSLVPSTPPRRQAGLEHRQHDFLSLASPLVLGLAARAIFRCVLAWSTPSEPPPSIPTAFSICPRISPAFVAPTSMAHARGVFCTAAMRFDARNATGMLAIAAAPGVGGIAGGRSPSSSSRRHGRLQRQEEALGSGACGGGTGVHAAK